MGKIFLHNDTAAPKLMGGKLVPPGESREVDDIHMPPGEALAEGPAEEPPAGGPDPLANLRDMLAQPLKAIVPQLPDFSDETLAELAGLEGLSETPRKGLLSAIGELQLQRAQAKTGGAAT